MLSFLSGKKTYLVAIAVAIVAGLTYAGVLDSNTAEIIYGLLGAGSIATLRSAISKIGS
jgi:hypothetical protein